MAEDMKEIVQNYVDQIYNRGAVGRLDNLLAEDYVNHTPIQTVEGVDGVRGFVTMLRHAFPDLRETVEDQIVEGDKEVHRWVIRGTHQGEFLGIPATGKEVTVHGITIARFAAGKIAEEWTQFDLVGVLQQLGAMPAVGDESG